MLYEYIAQQILILYKNKKVTKKLEKNNYWCGIYNMYLPTTKVYTIFSVMLISNTI